jgi:hypothetical protein
LTYNDSRRLVLKSPTHTSSQVWDQVTTRRACSSQKIVGSCKESAYKRWYIAASIAICWSGWWWTTVGIEVSDIHATQNKFTYLVTAT